MKVGVLTFHRASNYGTALQAYATIRTLQKCGVNAELIDYRPEYIERTLRIRRLREARSAKTVGSIVLNKAIYGRQIERKIASFQNYIDEMPVSACVCKTLSDVQKTASQYDVILSGSDQLWNEKITGRDMMYFFPFHHPWKISYASSFGTETISEDRKNEITPFLRDFEFISVRESAAQKQIQQMLLDGNENHLKLYRVVDPTLLLDRDEWALQRNVNIQLPESGFILTYYMIETPVLRAITDTLKKETGLPVVNIKPSKWQMILRQGINMMWAGPREFLSCYAGAKYVVTNSFHGTAFAVNFGTPMYVAPLPVSMAGEVNSRLKDILDWYKISNRWIDSIKKVTQIDPGDVSLNLEPLKERRKEESLNVLRKMLRRESGES